MTCARWALILAAVACTSACGETAAPPAPKPEPDRAGCAVLDPSAVDRLGTLALPVREVVYGQEIWISWMDKKHKFGFRYPRTRQEALALARRVCGAVDAGADIGALAKQHSNAPGGRAMGFCKLPRDPAAPDLRDRAVLLTQVGARTPLVVWNGGYWFARRVSDATGRQLEARMAFAMKQRARARAIVFHHDGAFPRRVRDKPYSQAQAVAHAKGVLEALAKGEDFGALAKQYSYDKASGARGGVLHATQPRDDESPEWIRWGDRGFPQRLLDVMLEEGPVGSVFPQPLLTKRGVIVVEVLERLP